MKISFLQEGAKVLSGIVAADFVFLLWFMQQKLLHMQGTPLIQAVVVSGILFDIGLFIILLRYVRGVDAIPATYERRYLITIGVMFLIALGVHLQQLPLSGSFALFGKYTSLWFVWIGIVVVVYLLYSLLHFITHPEILSTLVSKIKIATAKKVQE